MIYNSCKSTLGALYNRYSRTKSDNVATKNCKQMGFLANWKMINARSQSNCNSGWSGIWPFMHFCGTNNL